MMLRVWQTLASTAPIGNDSLTVACKALAQFRQDKVERVQGFMMCRAVSRREDAEERTTLSRSPWPSSAKTWGKGFGAENLACFFVGDDSLTVACKALAQFRQDKVKRV